MWHLVEGLGIVKINYIHVHLDVDLLGHSLEEFQQIGGACRSDAS